MNDPSPTPKIVKALYNFKGSNNDELWFQKGDIITVTQSIEGGWWEGTLDEKTGWFPSNFVKEVKQDARSGACSPTCGRPGVLPLNKRDSIRTYHDVVLRSLKDTERTFVNDLHLLLQTYLRPLQGDGILSKVEFSQLVGNLEELASTHHSLLAQLEDCTKLSVSQQRVGGIFLKMGPQVQAVYQTYCANHPRAVCVLQKHREELNTFMENKGAPTPGIETLTTGLSKPFSRLDKYPSMLKELERHTESACSETRRQKEVEYEIMNAAIKGWEGEEISKLGDVLLLSHVRVHADNGEKKERIFLLFPHVLLMLSVSSRMSQYVYEGKLPVSGMTVSPLEDTENISYAFEITGSMIDRRVVSCGSNAEKKQWVDTLRQQAKQGPGHIPVKPENLQISGTQPCVSTLATAKSAQNAQVIHPPVMPKPIISTRNADSIVMRMPWSMTCLRPAPPLRPILVGREEVARSPRTGRRLLGAGKRKHDDPKTLEEDAIILKVIEAYCTSAKARHTVNSLDLTKIRLTPNEMRDGRLGPTNYHNNHCDLVLSAIGFDLTTDLDLDNEFSVVEGQGRLLDSDSDGSEHAYVGLEKNPLSGRRVAQRLCCFSYGPTRTIACGFSKL
ncbi:hypothetical protein LSH36_680g01023 [Paralvinella palmiformis]|uniref:Rho guanine nucleotide exchange factor 7 n=1 Tax=Paralvinella palmiformis TaxID=53620 RepID=A0AAD9J3Q5_9ANNE|nr:hypothetical protein LSH36_680g01023 [Paralvinella palmiformis]